MFLQKTFVHESGSEMNIMCTTIDTGGKHTKQVYSFVKPRQGRRIYGVKGSNFPGKPVVSKPSRKNKGKIDLFMVGTDTAKESLFFRLKLKEPGPGFMHFPIDYPKSYFDQFAAEKKKTTYRKGFPFDEWVKRTPE